MSDIKRDWDSIYSPWELELAIREREAMRTCRGCNKSIRPNEAQSADSQFHDSAECREMFNQSRRKQKPPVPAITTSKLLARAW
jgi:hypothetical protein